MKELKFVNTEFNGVDGTESVLGLKIADILRNFSKDEMKRLGDFIKSPYFNSVEKLSALYEEVRKAYPDFEGEKLEYKIIYKSLYPGKAYKKQTIKNLSTEFGNIVKEFLAYEEFSRMQDLKDYVTAKSLNLKKSYALSDKEIQKFKNRKTEEGKESYDYYYYAYRMEGIMEDNLINHKKIDMDEIYNSLNAKFEDLIFYFTSEFYSFAFQFSVTPPINPEPEANRKTAEFINAFNPEIFLKFIDDSKHPLAYAVKINYLMYIYRTKGIKEEEYFELKRTLIKNINLFVPRDAYMLTSSVIQILFLRLVPLDAKYYGEVLEMAKFLRQLKLFPDDTISEFSFRLLREIFATALLLNEYEWAENFLDEYAGYINPAMKENELNYQKGMLYSKLKQYEKSLEYLNKVEYSDFNDKINVRFYYLINYIELNSFVPAYSMLKTIQQLLRGVKNIPEPWLIRIKDSLKFFSAIIKCIENNNKPDISIYKEAEATKRFFNRQYVLEKLKGMV